MQYSKLESDVVEIVREMTGYTNVDDVHDALAILKNMTARGCSRCIRESAHAMKESGERAGACLRCFRGSPRIDAHRGAWLS